MPERNRILDLKTNWILPFSHGYTRTIPKSLFCFRFFVIIMSEIANNIYLKYRAKAKNFKRHSVKICTLAYKDKGVHPTNLYDQPIPVLQSIITLMLDTGTQGEKKV